MTFSVRAIPKEHRSPTEEGLLIKCLFKLVLRLVTNKEYHKVYIIVYMCVIVKYYFMALFIKLRPFSKDRKTNILRCYK